jgi:hypothetical protein
MAGEGTVRADIKKDPRYKELRKSETEGTRGRECECITEWV